jgi:hypothetical protein
LLKEAGLSRNTAVKYLGLREKNWQPTGSSSSNPQRKCKTMADTPTSNPASTGLITPQKDETNLIFLRGGSIAAPAGLFPNPTDEAILVLLRGGCRTAHLADRLGTMNRRPFLLRRLRAMEGAGKVRRHPDYTAVNDIYWEPINGAA